MDEQAAPDTKTCTNCGTVNPAGNVVCTNCGAALDQPPPPPSALLQPHAAEAGEAPAPPPPADAPETSSQTAEATPPPPPGAPGEPPTSPTAEQADASTAGGYPAGEYPAGEYPAGDPSAYPPPPPGYPPGYAYPAYHSDKKLAAGLLGILLGAWGVHRFYLGDVGGGIIRIVITLFTCGIGGVIGLVEGIIYLTKSDWEFDQIYVYGGKEWF